MVQMWEYNRIEFEFELIDELTNELNKHGKHGWEIIYYDEIKPLNFNEKYKVTVLFKKNNYENKKNDYIYS